VRVSSGALAETDPLSGQLRAAITDLVTAGRSEATAQELLASLSPRERVGHTHEQVGRALGTLGVRGRRAKSNGARFRVYDLSRIPWAEHGPNGARPMDPAFGPGAKNESKGPSLSGIDQVPDIPIENRSGDSKDPAGPDD
jgi:hypothetical protein